MIKEFPNKMWKRPDVDYLIKKIDLDGRTAKKPGSGRSKSARTTKNVEIVSEMICSQEAQSPKPVFEKYPSGLHSLSVTIRIHRLKYALKVKR